MAKYFTKDGDDYKEVEAFSQDEVNDIVGKRVEREREKFSDYDDLKEKAGAVDTLKSETDEKLKKAGETEADLKKQLEGAKLQTEKVKIVGEFKLSEDLAEFVTGESADEMRKRAEKLAKGVKPSKVEIDKKPKPEDDKNNSKKLAGKLFGSKSDD